MTIADSAHAAMEEALRDLRVRLANAEIESEIAVAIEAGRGDDPEWLRGKAAGIRLALFYVDEVLRAQPTGDA